MTGAPPLFSGAVHVTLALLSNGVAVPIVGASGADGGGGANVNAIKEAWVSGFMPFHWMNRPPR